MSEVLKGVSRAMSKLAKLRWKKISKEKRRAWAEEMNKKRWQSK